MTKEKRRDRATPKPSKAKSHAPSRPLYFLSILLFALYLILLVWLISFKCNLKVTITDTYYLFGDMTWTEKLQFVRGTFEALFSKNSWATILHDARQDALNAVVFVPFGLYVAYFAKKQKLLRVFAISLLTSLAFESLQLVTHIGCFTAIDLVTNALGALIGYAVYRLIYKRTPKRQAVLSIISVLMLPVLLILVGFAVARTAGMLDFYRDVLLRRL